MAGGVDVEHLLVERPVGVVIAHDRGTPGRAQALEVIKEAINLIISTSSSDGPPGYRIGRHVRYRWTDIQTWLDEQADDIPRAGGTGDAA